MTIRLRPYGNTISQNRKGFNFHWCQLYPRHCMACKASLRILVWLLTLKCQMWVPKQSGWHITWCCHGWGAWIIFFAMVYQNDKFWKVFHQRLCKKLWLNCLKARLRPRLKVARKRGPNLVGQKKGAQYGMIVWAWCLAQKISCKISLT